MRITISIYLVFVLLAPITTLADSTMELEPKDRALRAELALANFVGTGKVIEKHRGQFIVQVTSHRLGQKLDRFFFIAREPKDLMKVSPGLDSEASRQADSTPSEGERLYNARLELKPMSHYLFVGTQAGSRFPIEVGLDVKHRLEQRVDAILQKEWPSLPRDLRINRLQLSSYLNIGRLGTEEIDPIFSPSRFGALNNELATDQTLHLFTFPHNRTLKSHLDSYLNLMYAKYKKKLSNTQRINSAKSGSRSCTEPEFKRTLSIGLRRWLSVWDEYPTEKFLFKTLSEGPYLKTKATTQRSIRCLPETVDESNVWEIANFLN
ncbi:MAG TPA: hypothetical protein PLZ57_09150 [Pseudobdellovibrionaceae bacterium]|nr:hypothetical protein [Pseudobdellovibrionaceae bacterium]